MAPVAPVSPCGPWGPAGPSSVAVTWTEPSGNMKPPVPERTIPSTSSWEFGLVVLIPTKPVPASTNHSFEIG